MRFSAISLGALTLIGCTVVNTATVSSDRGGKDVFITAGDIPEPYDSLGLVGTATDVVHVVAPSGAPVVMITSPTDGYAPPSSEWYSCPGQDVCPIPITLTATATSAQVGMRRERCGAGIWYAHCGVGAAW